MVFGLLFTICLSVNDPAQPDSDKLTQDEIEVLLKKYDQLDRFEQITFVDELGRQHKFGHLRAISSMGIAYAVTVLTRSVDSRRAIEFCKEFSAGSDAWLYAVWGLADQPRKDVIPYLREVAKKGNATVRAACYEVCICSNWPDLVDYARADRKNSEPYHTLKEVFRPEKLCDLASQYIKEVGEK